MDNFCAFMTNSMSASNESNLEDYMYYNTANKVIKKTIFINFFNIFEKICKSKLVGWMLDKPDNQQTHYSIINDTRNKILGVTS